MCAGDVVLGAIVTACDEDTQRTAPASSFSAFAEVLVARDDGVKAMISEGAEAGFKGHGAGPTQMTRSI